MLFVVTNYFNLVLMMNIAQQPSFRLYDSDIIICAQGIGQKKWHKTCLHTERGVYANEIEEC